MVTACFYNKVSGHLDFRFKLFYCSDFPEFCVWEFACTLSDRSNRTYAQYLAYAKDGKLIAREASYLGV